jgi:NADH dehydrogenase
VVIVGGGYAGATTAVELAKHVRPEHDIDILLIEPDPCQQALSELDLVAVGPARAEFCELWHPTVFRDLPVTVCYQRVEHVDPEWSTVRLSDGQEVQYWRLVVATGAIPSVPPIPGLRDRAITMWSVQDAQELQGQGEEAFREAARIADAAERRRLLSFAVVGGGATGVEIVGTLGKLLPKRARDHGIDPDLLQVSLVEGRSDILYDLPKDLRARAVRKLEEMNVSVVTGNMVERVEDDAVVLVDGSSVPANVLVWAGGAKADPHASDWGMTLDPGGRIIVDEHLKTPGHEAVYAIGDVAAARHPDTGRVLPMLAQIAIQQGPHAAQSILREASGQTSEPFQPHFRGEFVSVGPTWGVGWMYSLKLRGIPAIVMKRITYLKYWLQVGGFGLMWRRLVEMVRMSR